VVYAAHRNNRPWAGDHQSEKIVSPEYDPSCYLCPRNSRINNASNPDYKGIFIFNNDHPVVGLTSPEIFHQSEHFIYKKEKALGISRVVCYSPKHNISLSEMRLEDVRSVFQAFKSQVEELASNKDILSVLIFENKGSIVGVSNPHPHCQIYATDFHFTNVKIELEAAEKYKETEGINIFNEIINAEIKDGSRIIAENEQAIAFIPFFARYAYEVMIFPKRRVANMMEMSASEIDALAQIFQQVIRRYDLNFRMSFPYVMSISQSPIKGSYPDYHMYILLQPPLRQPGLKKYLAGPEIGAGNFMADTMPEQKAKELKSIDLDQYDEYLKDKGAS
jgi:UDPglucose--hexose-1-phosphate uridylyltransferase